MKKKIPLILLFVLLFSALDGLVYWYKDVRINDMLEEQQKYLEISYKQGLDRFNVIGENIYITMQNDTQLISLIATTNEKNIDKRHNEIYNYLKDEFDKLQLSGVMGLQIVRPNNQSIVRMHKATKYGDNLTKTRPMLEEVNKKKVHIHGFEEGKSTHAYRQIFPLYQEGRYIGALEVLFSSTKLQDYTIRSANIHTHFLVNKNVFKTNEWQSNAQDPYEASIEHKDYLMSFNNHINHQVLHLSAKNIIAPLQEEINEGVAKGTSFQLYKVVNGEAEILVFYAVNRFVDAKQVAYLVSYTKSDKLLIFLNRMKMVEIGLLLFLIFIYLLISNLLVEKETMLNELKYDALTCIYNRKYFIDLANQKYKIAENHNEIFSLVMVDIDFFKKVNDTYGHQCGDIVLQEFAKIFKESIRSMDVVARYGGEEFIIILLTNRENAFKIVEQIRKKVEAYSFGKQSINLTASFGIAQCNGKGLFSDDLKRADDALYRAKENGRNRIELA